MLLVLATRAKHDPNLLSLSRIRYFGVWPKGVASRRCWATQASVGERVTPTWITRRVLSEGVEEGKEWPKEQVSHRKARHTPRSVQRGCAKRSTTFALAQALCVLLSCLSESSACPPEGPVSGVPLESFQHPKADCPWPSA